MEYRVRVDGRNYTVTFDEDGDSSVVEFFEGLFRSGFSLLTARPYRDEPYVYYEADYVHKRINEARESVIKKIATETNPMRYVELKSVLSALQEVQDILRNCEVTIC